MATYYARQVLRACGMETGLTDAWLAALLPGSVVEAAAQLMAVPDKAGAKAYLLRAQGADGGWGEHPGLPSQVFDTAVAVIALRGKGAGAAVVRGRAWLVKGQREEGGWPETTRPPGAQSYAQHISTTAWATMALMDAER